MSSNILLVTGGARGGKSRFARVLDRLELSPGWTIDVDPVSLL